MQAVMHCASVVIGHSYEVDIRVPRRYRYFMEAFLPPYEQDGLMLALEGTLTVRPPGSWELTFKDGVSRVLRFTSDDGYNVRGEPYAAASPSASPFPLASPSAAPAASPSPAAISMERQPFRSRLYYLHPLSLLCPMPFKVFPPNVHFELKGSDTASGYECWEVNYSVRGTPVRLWVDKQTLSVVKVQQPDPEDPQGLPVIASYRLDSNHPITSPDPVTRKPVLFYPYTYMLLMKGDEILFELTFGTPMVSALDTGSDTSKGEAATSTGSSRPLIIDNTPIPVDVVFTTSLILVILVFVFLPSFLLTRTQLSRDLLLVEAPGGPLKPALEALGYEVELCDMELLGEERSYLGKKVGDRQARAVVVAPNAFHLVKSYLSQMRAYVEEGGRIFVLSHPSSAVSSMPFTPSFVANTVEDRYILIARSGFWKRLRAADVQTRVAHLMPKELYTEINQRTFDVSVLAAQNEATGARGIGIGVFREGKGEYLVCQLTLAEELTRTSGKVSPIARLMMLDLLDFLQARKPDPNAVVIDD